MLFHFILMIRIIHTGDVCASPRPCSLIDTTARVCRGRSVGHAPCGRANRPGQRLYAQKIARPPVSAQLWLANGAGTSPSSARSAGLEDFNPHYRSPRRRFSPTRFICRRRRSMSYEDLVRRQINAARWAVCRSNMNRTLHPTLWPHREMHWLPRRSHAKGSPGRATPVT